MTASVTGLGAHLRSRAAPCGLRRGLARRNVSYGLILFLSDFLSVGMVLGPFSRAVEHRQTPVRIFMHSDFRFYIVTAVMILGDLASFPGLDAELPPKKPQTRSRGVRTRRFQAYTPPRHVLRTQVPHVWHPSGISGLIRNDGSYFLTYLTYSMSDMSDMN